ncbi:MAG TPA: DEAD/DEAH box helicase [Candidatus Kapabacteria bacterium]|nr:DEAD/DEAH box helicase [Candidatus Kapabacteria bacterium]
MEFKSLHIIEPILRALHDEGYRTPTPIQAQAIPVLLKGRDLLGVAQTGTGKTAAFAIPALQILTELDAKDKADHREKKYRPKRRGIRCLILTPTRELAVQIDDSIKAYGRHLKLSSTVIFGGVSQGAQTNALRRGVDIVVATPGRLLDLMDQGHVHLDDIEIFVLDEADRMLDMGFVRDVQKIIGELPNNRQSLFFSATMPPAIVKLSDEILYDPVRVEVTPVSSTVDLIEQSLYFVEKGKKQALLMHVLEEYDIRTALVFTRTKHGADGVVRTLQRNNIKAEAIHGNKAQNARQRALNNFKDGKLRVLVATDIAARGIDVDDLEYVIQYEIPNVPETYVHRIGRTGRAGSSGSAFAFCAPDEKPYIRDIEKLIKKKIPVVYDHPFAKPEEPHHRPETGDQRSGGGRRRSYTEDRERRGSGRGPKPQGQGRSNAERASAGRARSEQSDRRSPTGRPERPPVERPASDRRRAERANSEGPRTEHSRNERPRSESTARPAAPKRKVEHGKNRRRPSR